MKVVLIFSMLLAAAIAADKACKPAAKSKCPNGYPVKFGTQCCPPFSSSIKSGTSGNPPVSFCTCSVGPTYSLDTLRKEGLKRHNELRKKHGVKPLKSSDKLNKIAQDYAEKLAKADKGLVHSEEKWGENLARSCGKDYKGAEPVQAWYDEIKNPGYNYNKPGFTKGTGHFTQLVWKASTEVGQGKAYTKDGNCVYVVANYLPAGNDGPPSEYTKNVPKPK